MVWVFDFGKANQSQKQAISKTEGPMLISAGPGTGKTFTLVKRVVYLIQEIGVKPENIFVATFTEKAAKELLTRISNELIDKNIDVDINEMYVGTFHALCLRIIRDNLEYSTIRKNFTLMDSFDQQYFIYQNFNRFFQSIENLDVIVPVKGVWNKASKLLSLFNGLTEELIDTNELIASKNIEINTLGRAKQKYEKLLAERNRLDFSSIQSHCLELLKNNPMVLEKYQNQFKYMMVDEYQDTNYIQEQLIFLLSKNKEKQNICVVGDDDQALYRFRGATIRNILEFSSKFPEGECETIILEENYRSNSDIVGFYNKWISETNTGEFLPFDWDNYRLPKRIKAIQTKKTGSDAVFKVTGIGSEENWHEKVLKIIEELKPNLTDLNQIAFLFNSVKSNEAKGLANFLERNGIGVYSPRSNMFFEREEIKTCIGLLLMMFPRYGQKLESGEFSWIGGMKKYYYDCLETAKKVALNDATIAFWLKNRIIEHMTLKKNTNYAFSGLFYQMFQFDYFKQHLGIGLDTGISDQRSVRNLSIFSNLLVKFEYNENISVLTKSKINKNVEQFFNNYLRFLSDGGIEEYQDQTEYAPRGCVSFLTIHQSKGMEFPIVFVGSMGNSPKKNSNELLEMVYTQFSERKLFEPEKLVKFFDFWRLYYVAFSRAQNMLILTTEKKESKGPGTRAWPSKYFSTIYNSLVEYSPEVIDLSSFEFNVVKDTNLKESYAFTSDILMYENCALQYKVYRELGFSPVRVGSTLFGSLVHETIEDIHKAVLRGEEHQITTENIETWFNDNYRSLAESERSYLGEPQLNVAKKQILNYVERNRKNFAFLKEAEVEVSLVQDHFILKGKIDLLKGQENTVEIMDFKAEKKPDLHKERERYEQYKKQLEVYAFLVERKYGLKVNKMNLYYTGAENENPMITFIKNSDVIDGTISEFARVVEKIQKKDFSKLSHDYKLCSNCDMRFYCNRAERMKK